MDEKTYTLYDIVVKLTGPICPIGDTGVDRERYKNLNTTIKLLEQLLQDVMNVSRGMNREEDSIRVAGRIANIFIRETLAELQENP